MHFNSPPPPGLPYLYTFWLPCTLLLKPREGPSAILTRQSLLAAGGIDGEGQLGMAGLGSRSGVRGIQWGEDR